MAIIRFATREQDIPEGVEARYCERDKVWTWEILKGLCLEDREINMRDDSDFYMICWDEEKQKPFQYVYASTRGWTYPAYGSRVDATPEIRAKYEAYLKAEEEARRKARIAAEERKLVEMMEETGMTEEQIDRLRDAVGRDLFERSYLPLLRSEHLGRLRSDFRKSLAGQVRRWISGESEYSRPLSPRQEQYL